MGHFGEKTRSTTCIREGSAICIALRECTMLAVSAQESALAAHSHAASIAPELTCWGPWAHQLELSGIINRAIRRSVQLSQWTAVA